MVSLAVQTLFAQNVDDGAGLHLPRPSQPAVQLDALMAQLASAPAGEALHVPTPFRLQRLHAAHEPVLQQTPSTQLPVAHSVPPPQT
jgi:hypothetical protein